MITVHRVPCLADNYAWLVVADRTREAAVVDPSEAAAVERALGDTGARLRAIWNTHHHGDHVGGNLDLCHRFGDIEVFGSQVDSGRIPGQTHPLHDGETLAFAGGVVEVAHVPGHTRGAIAYRLGKLLFTGDTLFGGGCGRLFEGTPAEMQGSLARLGAMPDDMIVHCGHEYTRANLRFALTVEPDNQRTRARLARLESADGPTVPFTLAEELATNPFLRWDAPAVQRFAGATDPVEVFAAVRRAKDAWR